MDRLTARTGLGRSVSATYGEEFIFNMDDEEYSAYQRTMERLAAYEDTELTPEEITALIVDNKRLHELVDILENTIKAL